MSVIEPAIRVISPFASRTDFPRASNHRYSPERVRSRNVVVIGRAVRTMLLERGLAHRPVVGMEAIQEGLERVGEFVVRVAQQLLVARRVVDVPAAEVPVPDARIAAIHREVEALLAHAQRVLQRVARAQHAPRERDAGDDERARGEYQRDFENSLRPPRGLAQRAGERDLQRSKPPVGVIDPRENRVERGRLVVAGDDVRVEVLRGGAELGDSLVAFGPDADCAAHEAHVAEAAEQHDHSVDILGIVLAGEESLAGDGEIGLLLRELEPRPAVAHRHRYRLQIASVISLGPRLRVTEQAVHRVLLRLRPETFAPHVGAAGGDDLQALARQEDEQNDDGKKRPRDAQQSTVVRHPHPYAPNSVMVLHATARNVGAISVPHSRAAA